ncbi:MAG: TonB-dependent receptor [Sulfuritalea sp.]|nr:TonB-dependent receptor [Sulfuritalea sp.]
MHQNKSPTVSRGRAVSGSARSAAGKALFQGLEFSADTEMSNGFFGRAAWTWLPTAMQSTAYTQIVGGAPVAGSLAGKRQPYAPKNTLTLAAGYGNGAFRSQIEAQHVGEQYTDFANTETAVAGGNGQIGKLATFTVWNASLNYTLQPKKTSLFLLARDRPNGQLWQCSVPPNIHSSDTRPHRGSDSLRLSNRFQQSIRRL